MPSRGDGSGDIGDTVLVPVRVADAVDVAVPVSLDVAVPVLVVVPVCDDVAVDVPVVLAVRDAVELLVGLAVELGVIDSAAGMPTSRTR